MLAEPSLYSHGLTGAEQNHLLKLFQTHANNQQHRMAPIELVCSWTKARKCPHYLLSAIYATAVRYTSKVLLAFDDASSAEYHLASQARQGLIESHGEDFLAKIFTNCILSFVEFRRGNGAQAWLDLGAYVLKTRESHYLLNDPSEPACARALLQVLALRHPLQPSDPVTVELVESYITTTTCTLFLGHPSSPITSEIQSSHNTHLGSSDDAPCNNGSDILQVLYKVQGFWAQSATSLSEMRHWEPDSAFMSLKKELDTILIRQSNRVRFSSDRLMRELDRGEGRAGEYLFWPLAWHCAVILLSRSFLPITISSSGKLEATCNYPGAPAIFVEDRLSVLRASATAISFICSDVMACGQFLMVSIPGEQDFPMRNSVNILIAAFSWLLCFAKLARPSPHDPSAEAIHAYRGARKPQNQLHDADCHEPYIQARSIMGIILSCNVEQAILMSLQLTQLMDMVDPHTKYAEGRSPAELFRNYFARFHDLSEAPFVQMAFQTDNATALDSTAASGDNVEATIAIDSSEPREHGPAEEDIAVTDAWISQYRDDLEECVSSRGEESGMLQPSGTPRRAERRHHHSASSAASHEVAQLQQWSPAGRGLDVQALEESWVWPSDDLLWDGSTWDVEAALFPLMST